MDLRNVIIDTKRLVLKRILPEHREEIFRGFTEAVARYTYPQPTGDIEDTDDFIRFSTEEMVRGENLQLVAIVKDSGEFIGCMGVHQLMTKPEIGLWLKESAWGKGYGSEIVAALKYWAEGHLDYEYLYYPVHKDNVASRRLAEKLGGVLEPEEYVFANARGERHPGVVYRVPNTEF